MTSLANTIPIEKYFWTLIFYLQTDFQIFAAHFRTKGMLNHGKIIASFARPAMQVDSKLQRSSLYGREQVKSNSIRLFYTVFLY